MANRVDYGFRWTRANNGGKECPPPEKWPIATGYQGAVQGGTNVDLHAGDVVKRLPTGYISLAEGTEITGYSGTPADIPLGIIVGFAPYFDGTVLQPTNFLPGGTAYGTNFKRQSFAFVVPAQSGVWEVDIDTAAAAHDTYAEYLAFVGERVDFVNSNTAVAPNGVVKADPQVDISTHATTATLRWTIFNLSPSQDSLDFAGENFKLLLIANSYADAPNTVGV